MKYKIPKGTKVLVAVNNSTTANYPLVVHVLKHDMILREKNCYDDSVDSVIDVQGPARFFYSPEWGWNDPHLPKTSDLSAANFHAANYDVFYTENRWYPFVICQSPLVEYIDE